MGNKKESSIDFLEQKFMSIFVNDEGFKKVIEQAKAMNTEEIDYKIQKAIEKFEQAKNKASTLRDMVYLDGVLSILDTIKNETYKSNEA